MFGQNRKRLQTFVQPSDDDQRREDTSEDLITWKKLYFLPRKSQRYFLMNSLKMGKTKLRQIFKG